MLKDFIIQLHYIPQAAVLAILFIFSWLFIRENKGNIREKLKELFKTDRWLVAFLCYAALLMAGTIMSRPLTNPYVNPIGTIGFMKDGKFNYILLPNIVVFVPYTVLFLNAFKPKEPFWKCFLLSFSTTVVIELFQLLFWVGQFAIADLIHNIIGGMIGCGIWALYNYIKKNDR